MAKKTTETSIERTYTIPLRKEFRKVPNWRQTKKAVKAVREFLVKHMKSDQIKLGKSLNEKLWNHGIRNPPHKVKVTVRKDEKGEVKAELFGTKIESPKVEEKPISKKVVDNKETTIKKEIKSIEESPKAGKEIVSKKVEESKEPTTKKETKPIEGSPKDETKK